MMAFMLLLILSAILERQKLQSPDQMEVKILAQSRSDLEGWLGLINMKLNVILLMERIDMADEAALDQALSDLSTQVSDLQTAAQAIVDKVSSMPDAPDLSDEIATIQGFGSQVEQTTTALKDATSAGETQTGGTQPPEEPV